MVKLTLGTISEIDIEAAVIYLHCLHYNTSDLMALMQHFNYSVGQMCRLDHHTFALVIVESLIEWRFNSWSSSFM